ncbi:metallopeptidase family protein [Luteolibacter algae]|uniref:Metallopeptidase family protein n=1 Tax=Luteolibacter algae TaxID=454151 RepID=A0ABW5D3E5_9BACT
MEFEKLCELAAGEVKMIVDVLPEEVRPQAAGCPVYYEAKPLEGESIEEDALGVFQGTPIVDEDQTGNPPRIRIFVENMWEYAERDEQDFLDEVGTTYLHELSHYLGWDEEEVGEFDLE